MFNIRLGHYLLKSKYGFIYPSTIFMMMWAFACISCLLGQNIDGNEFSMGFDIADQYVFYFICISFSGFICITGIKITCTECLLMFLRR